MSNNNNSSSLTETKNQDIQTIERYAEYQEKVKTPTQIITYYYDDKGNEQLPEPKALSKKQLESLAKISNITYEEAEKEYNIKRRNILHELTFPKDKATMQGESQSMQVYVKNNLERNVVLLHPYTRDKHLNITEYPEKLNPGQIGKIRVTFSPTYERFDGLDTTFGFNLTLRIKDRL